MIDDLRRERITASRGMRSGKGIQVCNFDPELEDVTRGLQADPTVESDRAVRQAIAQLQPVLRRIIRGYFFEAKTQRELGAAEGGMTQSDISLRKPRR